MVQLVGGLCDCDLKPCFEPVSKRLPSVVLDNITGGRGMGAPTCGCRMRAGTESEGRLWMLGGRAIRVRCKFTSLTRKFTTPAREFTYPAREFTYPAREFTEVLATAGARVQLAGGIDRDASTEGAGAPPRHGSNHRRCVDDSPL
eukprot:962283-Prorocentrum_minimum.AAC.2